jgi:hypothetical protein
MSTRTAYFCLLLAATSVFSGCAVYKNAGLCKQRMVATYPSSSPALTYDLPKASTGGAHVVAEATYKETLVYLKKKPNDPSDPGVLVESEMTMPAAVECIFDGETMSTFRWLVPEKYAAVYKDVPDINGEVHKEKVQLTAFPDEPASAPVSASSAAAR